MSNRWPGGIVRNTPVTPSGPYQTSAASGMWTLAEAAYWKKQGLWPDPNADAYWTYTSLLLSTTSLSNANNSLFVDSSGAFNPVSRNGNTTQGSFTPYSTNWSNYFDGSGDYLTVSSNAAFGMGTGDFTIECWVNPTAFTGSGNVLVDMRSGTEPSIRPDLEYNSSGVLNYRVNGSTVISGGTLVIGTWSHVALARSGTTTKLFLNGVQVGSSYSDSNNYGSSAACRIGADDDGSPNAYVNGYMSNVRVVKGTAVYTSNFTVPTAQLTAISGTSLLTCQSNRFRDASSNNFTITVNGDTRVTGFGPFSPGAAISYNQSDITNWSGYFGATGQYLSVPYSSAFNLTGDFTVECWINPGNLPSTTGNAPQSYERVFSFGTYNAANSIGLEINSNDSGNVRKFICWYNGTSYGLSSNNAVFPGNWYHIALVRSGTVITLYINGTSTGLTITGASAAVNTSQALYIASLQGFEGDASAAYNGYISNFRVVKGTAVYTANFTPPTTNLTAISGTSLLTLQNAAFTDNSTNNFVITPFGNTTVTGNSPFNTVGYWSNYFDASGDYQRISSSQVALQFGTGDFTIEGWAYSTGATGTYQQILTGGSSWTSGSGGVYWYYNGGSPYIGAAWNQIATNPAVNSGTLATNTWHHFAVVRSGNTLTLYINGSSVDTLDVTGVSMAVNNQSQTNIGGGGWDQDFGGYLSNLRVVKGTAVYTSNFTVPTTPLTAITNTSLLVCQSSRFIDSSTNAFTLVPAGNVAVQSFDPFYTATIASNGGSMYFDGSGDYLQVPTNASLQFGTSDFTVEFWMNLIARDSSGTAVFNNYNSFTTGALGFFAGHASASSTVYQVAVNGTFPAISSTQTIVYNSWNHFAIVRNGNTLTLYINGVANGTFSMSGITINGVGSNWWLGSAQDAPSNYELNGYLANFRVSKFAVYTAAFTPPTAPLTPSANTTLLVNGMNAGIYDATTINDMETVGNAQVSTSVSKFGGSSVYFDGTGDWLDIPSNPTLDFGTGDITIECWLYVTSVATTYQSICQFGDAAGTAGFHILTNTNTICLRTNNSQPLTTSGTITANTWNHIALTRASGTTRLFINGTTSGGTYNWTASLSSGSTRRIGADIYGNPVNGYIDDFRVTRGVARYTANFTPPTQAFPVY